MKTPARIHILGAIGLAAFVLSRMIPPFPAESGDAAGKASEIMAESEKRIRECRERRGLPPDASADINRTGLIGIEASPVTTTLGDLEAKRTAANPDFAALVVRLLEEAGVGRGDVVALGASSSFPGAILAALSAGAALDIEILGICSLGASQWGANDPRFDWLDMSECAARDGGPRARWLALTTGGEGDVGRDLTPEGRRFIAERIRRSGVPSFEEPDLARNVGRRIRLYEEAAGRKPIKAFINIGGAWANIGTDSSVLRVEPGLTRVREIPPRESRGVLQEMAARGVPVIHLLNIKGLASRYGLPLDPGPLPVPGAWGRRAGALRRYSAAGLIGLAYVGLVVLALGAAAISRSGR